MIKSVLGKKEYLLVFIFVFSIIAVNQLSLSYINKLQKNAQVVNYISILKGTTERLIKEEMQGFHDNTLIVYIDSIIYDLLHDKGDIGLVVIQDTVFLGLMDQVQNCWEKIKEKILYVKSKQDDNFSGFFELSEDYFGLVNKAAIAAEAFAERKVNSSRFFLQCANVVFIIFMMTGLISFLKAGELRRKTEIINKIAYVDTLTQMPNRASCEIEIDNYRKKISQDLNFAALVFDINNLKRINDLKGRQSGDGVIADFGRILKEESEDFGFVGRYGGDVFLGIFKNCTAEKVKTYIQSVNERVAEYNNIHDDNIKQISFAVGYFIGNPGDNNLTQLINNANKLMYEHKRKMNEETGNPASV